MADIRQDGINELCPIDNMPWMTCGHQTLTKPVITALIGPPVSRLDRTPEEQAAVDARRERREARAAQ